MSDEILKGVTPDQTIIVTNQNNTLYLPVATEEARGSVQIGENIDVDENGVISVDINTPLSEYTYNKSTIDGKDAAVKSYVDANFYTDNEADVRFVHLFGSETIAGIKTFSSSPIVPTPIANTQVGNKKYTDDKVANYAYSKSQVDTTVGGLETEIARVEDLALAGNTRYVFDSTAQLTAWIAGTYTRPDGVVVADLEIGNVIYTLPNDENDYWVKILPVEELADLEIWLGDPLDLEASNVTFDKTGTNLDSTNAEDAIKEVNDKSDLKTQNVALEDLTIGTVDWQEIDGFYFYEYTNVNATNPLTQKLDFVFKGDPTQADMLIAEKIIITTEEFSEVGVLGLRFRATSLPSGDITFGIILSNLSNEIIPQGILQAEAISYDNATSGLIATEVQSAVDELKGITDDLQEDVEALQTKSLYKDLYNNSGFMSFSGIGIFKANKKYKLTFNIEAPEYLDSSDVVNGSALTFSCLLKCETNNIIEPTENYTSPFIQYMYKSGSTKNGTYVGKISAPTILSQYSNPEYDYTFSMPTVIDNLEKIGGGDAFMITINYYNILGEKTLLIEEFD